MPVIESANKMSAGGQIRHLAEDVAEMAVDLRQLSDRLNPLITPVPENSEKLGTIVENLPDYFQSLRESLLTIKANVQYVKDKIERVEV